MESKNKIIDLQSYKVEKALKKVGFTLKHDKKKNLKVLMKINNENSDNRPF